MNEPPLFGWTDRIDFAISAARRPRNRPRPEKMAKPIDTTDPAAFGGRPLTPRERAVRALGDRLAAAQRPIRILDAVRWDDSVERTFFAHNARELPAVSADYYSRRPLGYDPHSKFVELSGIERDVTEQLGNDDAAGQIMTRMCRESREAVQMLLQRGTPAFAAASARLYGRAADRLRPDGPSLADLGPSLSSQVAAATETSSETTLDSTQAVEYLSDRFRDYFRDHACVRVRVSDDLVADAAAGCDYLKLRRDARFSPWELRLLEVHEGWVHLGTTLNGQSQSICTFLGRSTPSATLTQEGLAVFTEVAASASHPCRMRRLAQRVAGVALAESGADFLEVYRSFVDQGVDPRDSYQLSVRVFRGSLPQGCGPFTKDLCYGKGFLLVADRLREAGPNGLSRLVSLLFSGKTSLADLPQLERLAEEGVLQAPRFVPPPLADTAALSTWLTATRLDRPSPLAAPHSSVNVPSPLV